MKFFRVGKSKLEKIEYEGKRVYKLTLLNHGDTTLLEVIITKEDFEKLESEKLLETSCLYKIFR